jgi:hypothetical protein
VPVGGGEATIRVVSNRLLDAECLHGIRGIAGVDSASMISVS